MTTLPGWYDAGFPGKLRWWDGSQWTASEAEAGSGPHAGWYPSSGGVLRWWDGRVWTGLRVRNGVPGSDWAASESPRAAWALGALWTVLALGQISLGLLGSGTWGVGIGFAVVAALWIAIAVSSSAVRRLPAPTADAEAPDVVRPLPGEVEGDGAHWHPVAPRTTRWWTGSRWAEYIGTRYGMRPTFQGRRAYRALLVVCWSLTGISVAAAVVGVVLWIVATSTTMLVAGVGITVGGVFLAVLGVVLLFVSRSQRRVLLVPPGPPN